MKKFEKLKTKINKTIANLLPKKVLYWCVIRAWAITTTEKYITKTPYEVDWEMVCKYLEQ